MVRLLVFILSHLAPTHVVLNAVLYRAARDRLNKNRRSESDRLWLRWERKCQLLREAPPVVTPEGSEALIRSGYQVLLASGERPQ